MLHFRSTLSQLVPSVMPRFHVFDQAITILVYEAESIEQIDVVLRPAFPFRVRHTVLTTVRVSTTTNHSVHNLCRPPSHAPGPETPKTSVSHQFRTSCGNNYSENQEGEGGDAKATTTMTGTSAEELEMTAKAVEGFDKEERRRRFFEVKLAREKAQRHLESLVKKKKEKEDEVTSFR